jgi:hypothetical protein
VHRPLLRHLRTLSATLLLALPWALAIQPGVALLWNPGDGAVWAALEASTRTQLGVLSHHQLVLIDDGGEAQQALAKARELMEAGALALVCCSTPEATVAVAFSLAREAPGMPLLALHALPQPVDRAHFVLHADDTLLLSAIAVDATTQGKASLALLSVDNDFGAATLTAFQDALSWAQRGFAGEARYAPAAQVLTPEALWVATRDAGAIVHWGEGDDLPRAVDALRRRGYAGLIYVRPATLSDQQRVRLMLAGPHLLDPSDPALGLRSVANPIEVQHLLPPNHPNRTAIDGLIQRIGSDPWLELTVQEQLNLARVDDAASWLFRALDVVATLGIANDPAIQRSALRDALVTLPPLALSSGSYDANERGGSALSWRGLIPVMVGPATPASDVGGEGNRGSR